MQLVRSKFQNALLKYLFPAVEFNKFDALDHLGSFEDSLIFENINLFKERSVFLWYQVCDGQREQEKNDSYYASPADPNDE